MSVRLTVGQETIIFPTSGTDANWAPAVVQFATAVANQLSAIASQFDVSPRVQVLTSDSNSAITVQGCSFPSDSVRSFVFTYAIYRTNGVDTLAEDGIVSAVYNTALSQWDLQHEYQGTRQLDGSSYHTFTMNGDTLALTTVAIGGSYDSVNSKISYGASTILTSDI